MAQAQQDMFYLRYYVGEGRGGRGGGTRRRNTGRKRRASLSLPRPPPQNPPPLPSKQKQQTNHQGHRGKFGHEFLEFEFRPDGELRYRNNSNYKSDTEIRKRAFVSPAVLGELRRIIADSEIMREDDANWPPADRVGKQELEIKLGGEHVCFNTTKLGSVLQVQQSKDPEGLRIFYYLVQDLKCLLFSLISAHFKIQPISK